MEKTQLEKFKFATLKNINIEVEELDNKIEIRIEPVSTEAVKSDFKPIEVYYKPLDHYGRGDFNLLDDHKKIEISRSYAVANYDYDDIDWDFESIYPCEQCNRKEYRISGLEKRIQELKEIINKLIS